MKLTTLRCPSCQAPVEGFHGQQTTCRYCGATILAEGPRPTKTETRFSVVLRVGPSNVDRIAALLSERLGIELTEAQARLSSLRYELESGTDEGDAQMLARGIVHAGGDVDVVRREVEIPLVRVWLEAMSTDKLATIRALRQHLDLGIQETRQMIDRAPVVVVESIEEPLALDLIAALQRAGARARIG